MSDPDPWTAHSPPPPEEEVYDTHAILMGGDADEEDEVRVSCGLDSLYETDFCCFCKYSSVQQGDARIRDKLSHMETQLMRGVHSGIDERVRSIQAYYIGFIQPLLRKDNHPDWPVKSIRDHVTGAHGTAQITILRQQNAMFVPRLARVMQDNIMFKHKKSGKIRPNWNAIALYLKMSKHIQRDFPDD